MMTAEDAQRLQAAVALIGQTLQDSLARLAPVARALMAQMREHYVDAGAPYGPSDDAMWAFYRDMATAVRERDTAYDATWRAWSIEDFGRQVRGEERLPAPTRPPIEPYLPERLRAVLLECTESEANP